MTNKNSGLRVKPAMTSFIEYGLYLLVFLLPIQTRWIIKSGELEYTRYSLYGTDILLALLLILSIIVIASDRKEPRLPDGQGSNLWFVAIYRRLLRRPDYGASRNDRMVWWFIGGLLLMSAISVFFAVDKMLALYKLGWLILAVGLFWLMVSANYDRLKLIYAMLAGIFFQAVLGGWQFLTQSSFKSKWLGLALHNRADLGASVIETGGAGERWLRAYGGLDHPNVLGGALAVGILLLIGIMNYDPPVGRAGLRIINKIKIFTSYFLLFSFSAALFFSFSRAAWLALTLGIGVMLIEAVIKKNYRAQKNILQAVLISGLAFFILFFQFSNLVTARVSGRERLELKSVNERVASLKNSLPIIKNNWLIGAGLGNYVLALKRHEPGQESFYYQPAHNVFLLVWAETGILGLIFFIGLLFIIVSERRERSNPAYSELNRRLPARTTQSGRLRRPEYGTPRNDRAGAPILITLIIIMTTDHWLWSLHFGALFFWLVLGVVANGERNKRLSLKQVSGFLPARE